MLGVRSYIVGDDTVVICNDLPARVASLISGLEVVRAQLKDLAVVTLVV